MHKHFADWYNAVSLRPDAKTLEARWTAVEVLAGELKVPEVPGVVRVFFGLGGADPYLDRIRAAARGQDTTFVTEGDKMLLMRPRATWPMRLSEHVRSARIL